MSLSIALAVRTRCCPWSPRPARHAAGSRSPSVWCSCQRRWPQQRHDLAPAPQNALQDQDDVIVDDFDVVDAEIGGHGCGAFRRFQRITMFAENSPIGFLRNDTDRAVRREGRVRRAPAGGFEQSHGLAGNDASPRAQRLSSGAVAVIFSRHYVGRFSDQFLHHRAAPPPRFRETASSPSTST